MKDCKHPPKPCDCNSDLIECVCELEKELDCFKHSFGHNKNFSRITKEKVLFCIVLREIGKLDKKLDKILHELDCGWSTACDSDSDCGCGFGK